MLASSPQMCNSMVVVFVRRRQQQQQRFISCCRCLITTTTRATTITKLKEVVVVDGVKQQHQHLLNQQQRSLLLLHHPFSTTSMSYFGSNKTSKRTMMTNNNNSSKSNIISNRGGAIIPNLLSINNEIGNYKNQVGLNIHLPPPDEPVGLQLYKKVLYCPNTNILRTSLHIGTDDLNQKVNGIVVGNNSNSNDDNILVGNDNNDNDSDGIILISSKDANNHARNSGLRLLSSIHHYLNGDLSRVEQIISVTGIVNVGKSDSDSNNNKKPLVPVPYGSIIDGCSQVFAEAFGSERGIGTRVCYGGSIGSTVACYVELRIRPPL